MTITQVFEQARLLNLQERKELIKLLVDTFDVDDSVAPQTPQEEHWGKSLNRMLDEMEPIEMLYPEIEDPVEWVKRLRADEQRRRLGDWGIDE